MALERWPVPTSTYNASIVAHASANTKGAYADLSAATGITTSNWQVQGTSANTPRTYLADIATGAGGAEAIQVANLMIQNNKTTAALLDGGVFRFTSDIASGTRVAARCQSSTGAAGFGLSLLLASGALASRPVAVTYGAVTATSRGTVVDPGGSANTKGAYVDMTASSTADLTRLLLVTGIGINTALTFAAWAVDVSTGAGGAETIVVPDQLYTADDLTDMFTPTSTTFDVTIASGTRIAVRAQCLITDATDRVFQASVLGEIAPAGGGGAYAFAG